MRQAALYVAHGLACIRCAPWLYVSITCTYVTPALVAALLVASVREPVVWQQAIVLGLPWVTIILGAVVIMVAVAYQARGQRVDLVRATGVGVRWVPRYVWTNVHTSIIFWVPIGTVLAVRDWQAQAVRVSGAAEPLIGGLWWLAVIALGLYLHTRTLLAPFLAVHADLPGTLAALEGWRLGGRYLGVCFATLVLGCAPVGIPLAVLGVTVSRALPSQAPEGVVLALPDFVWVAIQAVRPVLIAALYPLYHDLWERELAQQRPDEAAPGLVRAMLAVTRSLPKLGKWE